MRIIGNNPAADNAEITAVASGTLPDGKPVIVNANGTVTVVQLVTETLSQALGTNVNINANYNGGWHSSAFDSQNNKVVVAYQDDNTNYGMAVVGTVNSENSTTISFGTPVVFKSAACTKMSVTFDSNRNRIAIFYARSNDGYGITGSVSGTTISFAAESSSFWSASTVANISSCFVTDQNNIFVAFSKAASSGGNIIATIASNGTISYAGLQQFNGNTGQISVVYDTFRDRVILAFRDTANSSYGTIFVCTVSGTNVQRSSNKYVFNSGATQDVALTFDSTAQKVVIFYTEDNPKKLFSKIGTTGTGSLGSGSISFGSEVTVGDYYALNTDCTFDSNSSKVVVAFRDQGNASAQLLVGSVSGTSISFGTAVEFNNSAIPQPSIAFDSNTKTCVLAFGINSPSKNVGRVFRNASSYTVANLTAENFIGFANGAAADTGTARVQIGSGINGAQSSLTAGQQYFVQTDGTLGLTAASPSVIAGTAVSATDIIVKG